MTFEDVLVVGAGQMGGGIAQVVAASGRHVALHDAQPGATDRALAAMRKSLTKLEEKGDAPADDVLRRITVVDDLVPAALMIEAVVEDADVKEQLFRSGLDASPSTPKEFGAYIKSEMAKWSKVVKASGAKAE